jgi:hypothetical protein
MVLLLVEKEGSHFIQQSGTTDFYMRPTLVQPAVPVYDFDVRLRPRRSSLPAVTIWVSGVAVLPRLCCTRSS